MSHSYPSFESIEQLTILGTLKLNPTNDFIYKARIHGTTSCGYYWHLRGNHTCYGPFRSIANAIADYNDLGGAKYTPQGHYIASN